ncbi:MAG: GNAT family protein [Candidatus Auribacterota bacterium]|nr:GNAT family protein [Candidatus Auribacterota bacterium]
MIRLRPMNRTDLGDSFCCMNDIETARLINRNPVMTYARHVSWFETAIRNTARVLLTIEDDNGKYIGTCGFNHIDHRKRQAEIWIAIDKYSRGVGYGISATEALLQYGFLGMDFSLIYLHVLARNIPAINLYTKLGFRKTDKTLEYRGPNCMPEQSFRMELRRNAYHRTEFAPNYTQTAERDNSLSAQQERNY